VDEDEEVEAGKAAFLAMVAGIDPEIAVVIPTRATQDQFLISLTRAGKRVFVTVAEDDLIDLPEDPDVAGDVRAQVDEALGGA
jgi:hypothetical protein